MSSNMDNNGVVKLKIDKLNKSFFDEKRGEVKAVNDVSLECYEGEIFGLLGPNGAGKTTTLRMVSTLMKPSSGEVFVNDFSCEKNP